MKKEKLLDVLSEERLYGALEESLKGSKEHRLAEKEHHKACDELEKVGLSKKQNKAVENALSTASHCSAVYGAVAYRQGLDDGIKLMAELKERVIFFD